MDFKDIEGKKILRAIVMHKEKYIDNAYLKLEFEDKTSCVIYATYDEYPGAEIAHLVEGEYPCVIGISRIMSNLIPTEEQANG